MKSSSASEKSGNLTMFPFRNKRRGRTRRACLILVGTLASAGYLVMTILTQISTYYNMPPPVLNYFVNKEEIQSLGYLIESPSCNILNVPAWHHSILHLVSNISRSKVDCKKEGRGDRVWTFVKDQKLVINVTAVISSGYSHDSIHCCYKSFNRVQQSEDNYDLKADTEVRFSEDCNPMPQIETELKESEDFLRVLCYSKYWPLYKDVVYRAFHAVPIPKMETIHKQRERLRKNLPKNIKNNNVPIPPPNPPNILLLGIDSMSRLSFERNMPKTRDYLKHDLGAVEILAYTKVGENTFPNLVPIMTGRRIEDLGEMCNNSESSYSFKDYHSSPLDSCPFLWKEFRDRGYLTAFLEDVPFLSIYNYGKVGFLRQPVDFYLRPYMLGLYQQIARKSYYYLDCIGTETVDEVVLKYTEDLLDLGRKYELPLFIKIWLTNLAHADLNGAQAGDATYADFLQRLDLNNTIIFFMSDHGYRYGPIRQTFAGWYEDKLPNLFVYLPKEVTQRKPEWGKRLLINSRRLSSPFDLHATLKDILDTFIPHSPVAPLLTSSPQASPPLPGISMLSSTPPLIIPSDRRCSDAGISDNYCACSIPSKLSLDDDRLLKAAKTSIESINAFLPKNVEIGMCEPLTFSNIQAGGILTPERGDGGKIIVAYVTMPGEFLFESTVQWNRSRSSKGGEGDSIITYTTVGEPLRMNKVKTGETSCLKNKRDMEKFCYCTSQ